MFTYSYSQDGNACAHIAASNGSIEVMKLLIKANSSIASATNKVGFLLVTVSSILPLILLLPSRQKSFLQFQS